MRKALVGFIAVSILGLPLPGMPGQDGKNPAQPGKRWSIAINLPIMVGGPTASIKKTFSATGFNGTRDLSDPIFDPTPELINYPRSTLMGTGMASVNYLFSPHWSIGIVGSFAHLETQGFNESLHADILIKTEVAALAPLLQRQEGIFTAGIGPALYFVGTKADDFLPKGGQATLNSPAQTRTKLGFLTDISFVSSASRRIFVEVRVQYRGVGAMGLGPFDVPYQVPGGVPAIFSFSAFKMKCSHLLVAVGLGVRL